MNTETQKSTNTIQRLFTLAAVVTVVLATGCGTLKTSPVKDASVLGNIPITVVPLKGPPFLVASGHIGTVIAFGLVGEVIETAVTQPKRTDLCDQANHAAVPFVPERILAEECADLLRHSHSHTQRQVTVCESPATLNGSAPLLEALPRPFSPKYYQPRAWGKLVVRWGKGKENSSYSSNRESVAGQDVALEVIHYAMLNNGKTLGLMIEAKLVETRTGQMLGFALFRDSYPVRRFAKAEDLPSFQEDFRKCARASALQCLKDMKLIADEVP